MITDVYCLFYKRYGQYFNIFDGKKLLIYGYFIGRKYPMLIKINKINYIRDIKSKYYKPLLKYEK